MSFERIRERYLKNYSRDDQLPRFKDLGIITEKQYDEWLYNLQELAMNEPKDLTDAEFKALEKEGLIY